MQYECILTCHRRVVGEAPDALLSTMTSELEKEETDARFAADK